MFQATLSEALAFIQQMGDAIAESGMFGCESKQQGRVIAWSCLSKQRDPLSLAETYHLMSGGKLSMKADAMLARFNDLGGKHFIQQRTPDIASVQLVNPDGTTEVFTLAWDDAQKEPFTKKKDGSVSPNYSTPRKRMQMLWARVVSDGVRAMMPAAVTGRYTPEESEEWTRFEPTGNVEAVVADTFAQPAVESKQETKAKPAATGQVFSARDTEPVSADAVAEIKQAIKELAQVDGYADIASRVKHKLADAGLEKLDQLTYREATDMLSALRVRSLDAFFTASLQGHGREGNAAAS